MAAGETTPLSVLRFGIFELDLDSGELRKAGVRLKLQQQPFLVLTILLERPGEIVTREELCAKIWPADTFVDFDKSLNTAVNKLRDALGDTSSSARFIETIPRRGYRFIAPVTDLSAPKETPGPAHPASPVMRTRIVSAGAVIVLVAVSLIWVSLRNPGFGKVSPTRVESIAVLPLRSLSSDAEQEYFSDGMTDELITDLARSVELRVISHTSVEHYKNSKAPLPEIAKELGVDAIVEGTVMRSADKVRITAQLIDARSDRHLWANSYKRDLREILSLQEEVARHIADEIATNLNAGERRQPASTGGVDPVAHEAYLRGNFYWNQMSCDGFVKGRQYFEQAVEKDPNFARAYVGVAESYFTLVDWGCSPDRELVTKSRIAARKALALDPNLGEAHAWLGKLAFFYDWNFPNAESELKRAIELSPNYPEAHMIYAVFLVTTGKPVPGLAEIKKAHDIDPISQLPNVIAVVALYLARQYDAAIEHGEKTVELYPDSVGAYYWLEHAYEKRGFYDRAAAAYLKMKGLQGASQKELLALQVAYQKHGVRGLWLNELEEADKNPSPDACLLSRIHAELGHKEQALEFLEQASQEHCGGPHTTVADPIFDEFRQDPKFQSLIARVGLPQ